MDDRPGDNIPCAGSISVSSDTDLIVQEIAINDGYTRFSKISRGFELQLSLKSLVVASLFSQQNGRIIAVSKSVRISVETEVTMSSGERVKSFIRCSKKIECMVQGVGGELVVVCLKWRLVGEDALEMFSQWLAVVEYRPAILPCYGEQVSLSSCIINTISAESLMRKPKSDTKLLVTEVATLGTDTQSYSPPFTI